MQVSIKGFITSKKAEYYSDCADRYAVGTFKHRFAISDGVTKSFFPKYWAEILVNKYVDEIGRRDFKEFIKECQQEWIEKVKNQVSGEKIKWYTRSALARNTPALATFAGLTFSKDKNTWYWEAEAKGDSYIFFIGEKLISLISTPSIPESLLFDNYPDYLTSIGVEHKGEWYKKRSKLGNGVFYLMTDALAEWFLKDLKYSVEQLSLLNNQEDFRRFIEKERKTGNLNNDDSAILMIRIEEEEENEIKYKSITISDINELITIEEQELVQKPEFEQTETSIENDLVINSSDKINEEVDLPNSLIKNEHDAVVSILPKEKIIDKF